MGDDIQTFRICQSQLELDDVTATLAEARIEFLTASNTASFDISTLGTERTGQILVRIRARDFERANQALLAKTESEFTELPVDHYLHEFADHELFEILAAAHEWNEFDVAGARHLLTKRGFDLSGRVVEEMQEKRRAIEREGTQGSRLLLIFGFMAGIFGIFYPLLSVISILIGWSFRTMKRTSQSGERYLAYDSRTRFEGTALLCFGIICFLSWGIVTFFSGGEYFFY